MILRKPNPYEGEALYIGAKEIAFKAGGSPQAAHQWLSQTPWLNKHSVDGITAKVAKRMSELSAKQSASLEQPRSNSIQ